MTPDAAATATDAARVWPLTSGALRHLEDEIQRVRTDLAFLTCQGLEEGIARLAVAQAARRLRLLERVLAGAELVDETPCAAIGRSATLRDADGVMATCQLVVPGEEDPARGRVSADSPIGAAVLGARAGDVVEISGPAGCWSVTVVSVDESPR